MENIVYLELRRKAISMNYEVFYYKKQVEIDFVLYRNGRVIELIQVSESIRDKKTYNREVRSLIQGSTELESKELKIITEDELDNGKKQIDLIYISNKLYSLVTKYNK